MMTIGVLGSLIRYAESRLKVTGSRNDAPNIARAYIKIAWEKRSLRRHLIRGVCVCVCMYVCGGKCAYIKIAWEKRSLRRHLIRGVCVCVGMYVCGGKCGSNEIAWEKRSLRRHLIRGV